MSIVVSGEGTRRRFHSVSKVMRRRPLRPTKSVGESAALITAAKRARTSTRAVNQTEVSVPSFSMLMTSDTESWWSVAMTMRKLSNTARRNPPLESVSSSLRRMRTSVP